MINKPVNWGVKIYKNEYVSSVASYVDQNLVNVSHFNRINSLDGKEYIKINKENPYYDVFHAMRSKDESIYEDIPTSIYEAFKFVIEKEITVKTTRAIKIEAGLTTQLEKHRTSAARGYVQNTNDPNDYVCYDILHGYQSTSNMLPFLYIFPENEKETKKYLDYLNGYVSHILDHIPSSSSTKYTGILGISFYVYRLSRTGSMIEGLEKYIKNKNTYTCLTIELMCVLECIYISVYKKEYKKAKECVRAIIPKLKKFYQELFNKPFSENEYLDGLDL
jgi:hypothetical protein